MTSPQPAAATAGMKVHLWAPSFRRNAGGIQTYSAEIRHVLAAQTEVAGFLALSRDELAPNSGRPRLLAARQALAGIRDAVRERPDVIWCTHLHLLPAALIAKRLSGARIVGTAHGYELDHLHGFAGEAAVRAADRILPVSRATAHRVARQFSLASSRICVIPNTSDPERFQPRPRSQKLMRRLGIREGERVLLAVGRLHPDHRYKGFERLIRSLGLLQERMKRVKLVIAGEGPDRSRLEKLAFSHQVAHSVCFTGQVDPEELPALYNLAQLFVLPSTQEGFGIVYLEALFSGVPVLTGHCGGAPEATVGGRCGAAVDARDPQRLVAAIEDLLARKLPPDQVRQQALEAYGPAALRARVVRLLADLRPKSTP